MFQKFLCFQQPTTSLYLTPPWLPLCSNKQPPSHELFTEYATAYSWTMETLNVNTIFSLILKNLILKISILGKKETVAGGGWGWSELIIRLQQYNIFPENKQNENNIKSPEIFHFSSSFFEYLINDLEIAEAPWGGREGVVRSINFERNEEK